MKAVNASPPRSAFSVCVYCGARAGALPAFTLAARALGQAVAQRGWQLVYGGGRGGLMGVLADAALAAGGRVVGVIPHSLMERELGHPGLAELHVVQTMHERKQLMAQHSDAFVALPGGIGTLEELFETWTWRQLGYHDKPLGLLNVEGYYDPLLAFVEHATTAGFLAADQLALLTTDTQLERLLDALHRQSGAPAAGRSADYSRT